MGRRTQDAKFANFPNCACSDVYLTSFIYHVLLDPPIVLAIDSDVTSIITGY